MKMAGSVWIILGVMAGAFSLWAIPHGYHQLSSAQSQERNLESPKEEKIDSSKNSTTTGDNSPSIIAGDQSNINVYYGNTVEAAKSKYEPKFEFYYQLKKGDPVNPDGTKNYEFGFKNITDQPLLNFEFSLEFRNPIQKIDYDFSRSTANMTGGKGLSDDKMRFHWFGNQIMEDDGWVVFVIKSEAEPAIRKLATKLVGRLAGSSQLIPADKEALKEIRSTY